MGETGEPRSRTFFSDVVLGRNNWEPNLGRGYSPLHSVASCADIIAARAKYAGRFDDHIRCSIPGFYEMQGHVGRAIISLAERAAPTRTLNLLDIGCSEGSWLKAVAEVSNGTVSCVGLEPNRDMFGFFQEAPAPSGALCVYAAFGEERDAGQTAWQEEAGEDSRFELLGLAAYHNAGKLNVPFYKADRKFDIVHEAMTFQFISNDRPAHFRRSKELMGAGGVLIVQEKLRNESWAVNETQKTMYKRNYFSLEALERKRLEVLETPGLMDGHLVGLGAAVTALTALFRNVSCFWNAGNFFGFVASDDDTSMEIMRDTLPEEATPYSSMIWCKLTRM